MSSAVRTSSFVKMALSCFLGKVTSTVLKGSALGNLNKNLIKPSCSVYFIRQSYHQVTSENSGKQPLSPLKYNLQSSSSSLINVAKQFSTSSALLSSYKDHDHRKLWTLERLLSLTLLPLVPAALMKPCVELDTALALIMVVHTHLGLEAIVVDYIRPILFGEVLPKVSLGLLYILSIVTLAGLLNLIYNDMGLANTILNVWKK